MVLLVFCVPGFECLRSLVLTDNIVRRSAGHFARPICTERDASRHVTYARGPEL